MKRWIVPGLIILAISLSAAPALAHERIVSGKYALVLGWLEEPPVVGLKNAVAIEVSLVDGGTPVTGAEGSLTAQIAFGGQSRDLVLRPVEGQDGVYAGDFIPTRRGTYMLKVGGTIDGQPIDASAEIEEVASAASLEFPEAQPAVSDLQQSIDQLQGDISSARTFGVAGLALAVIGLALAGVSLGRKR